ncbi:MAG: hypothetical protein K2X38_12340 [Gemmataceae bacterium]|nr:hypothetical protein [Gemmataceae bacterium]
MERGGTRRYAGTTRLGLCLAVALGLPALGLLALGLPALARAQGVAELPLKTPTSAPAAATEWRDNESFLQKLRSIRSANGASVRPAQPATEAAQGATTPVMEQPRGIFSRFKQPQPVAVAPQPAQPAQPNRGQLSLDEMYKYASGLASPAEIVATKIKADEGGAKSRLAAVQYLGSVDFRHYPEAESALISALRADRSEQVRYEVVEAFSRGQGLSSTAVDSLKLTAMGSERDGNPSEPSERVRAAALVALQKHWQGNRPDASETAPQRLPQISKTPTAPQPTLTQTLTQTKAETKVEPPTNDNSPKPAAASVAPRLHVAKPEPIKAAAKPEPKAAATSNDAKAPKQESRFSRWTGTNTTALTEQDKRKLRDDALRDDVLRDFAERVGASSASQPANAAPKQAESPTLFGAKTETKKQMPGEQPAPASATTAPPPLAGPPPSPAAGGTPPGPPPSFVPPPPPLPASGASSTSDRPLSSYHLEPIGTPRLR